MDTQLKLMQQRRAAKKNGGKQISPVASPNTRTGRRGRSSTTMTPPKPSPLALGLTEEKPIIAATSPKPSGDILSMDEKLKQIEAKRKSKQQKLGKDPKALIASLSEKKVIRNGVAVKPAGIRGGGGGGGSLRVRRGTISALPKFNEEPIKPSKTAGTTSSPVATGRKRRGTLSAATPEPKTSVTAKDENSIKKPATAPRRQRRGTVSNLPKPNFLTQQPPEKKAKKQKKKKLTLQERLDLRRAEAHKKRAAAEQRKIEEEKQRKLDQQRKAEEAKQQQIRAAKLRKEEEQRKIQAQILHEQKRKEEAEAQRLARIEQQRLDKEEQEQRQKEEEERKRKEEEERKRKEEEERKRFAEEERKRKEEEERKRLEEEEQQRKAEEERLAALKAEEERKRREQEQREEEERQRLAREAEEVRLKAEREAKLLEEKERVRITNEQRLIQESLEHKSNAVDAKRKRQQLADEEKLRAQQEALEKKQNELEQLKQKEIQRQKVHAEIEAERQRIAAEDAKILAQMSPGARGDAAAEAQARMLQAARQRGRVSISLREAQVKELQASLNALPSPNNTRTRSSAIVDPDGASTPPFMPASPVRGRARAATSALNRSPYSSPIQNKVGVFQPADVLIKSQRISDYVNLHTPMQLGAYLRKSGKNTSLFVNLSGIYLLRETNGQWFVNPVGVSVPMRRSNLPPDEQDGALLQLKGGLIIKYINQMWELIQVPTPCIVGERQQHLAPSTPSPVRESTPPPVRQTVAVATTPPAVVSTVTVTPTSPERRAPRNRSATTSPWWQFGSPAKENEEASDAEEMNREVSATTESVDAGKTCDSEAIQDGESGEIERATTANPSTAEIEKESNSQEASVVQPPTRPVSMPPTRKRERRSTWWSSLWNGGGNSSSEEEPGETESGQQTATPEPKEVLELSVTTEADTVVNRENVTQVEVEHVALPEPHATLLLEVEAAIQKIHDYFDEGNDEEKAALGDDSKNKQIARLCRGDLATAMYQIFDFGFLKKRWFKTYHIWDFVCAVAADQEQTSVIRRGTNVIAADDMMRDTNMRFRSWICYSLNCHEIHSWLRTLADDQERVQQFYSKESVFHNAASTARIAQVLSKLQRLPITLSLDYEYKV